MENEQVDQEEVWSAIRYLDPDEQDRDPEAKTATIMAVLALFSYSLRCLGRALAASSRREAVESLF